MDILKEAMMAAGIKSSTHDQKVSPLSTTTLSITNKEEADNFLTGGNRSAGY